ncbi:MAG TPA: aspartate--tRNA ligase [Spirochaetota bacterium]|nr:aspartate--tRNA ligase [Spirochaetota bacterium]
MFEERVYCGELTVGDIGKSVVLAGWVDTKRDLGGVVFLEIRDVTGIMQAVVHPAAVSGDTSTCADRVRDEYCVMVRGKVVKRSDETVNPNLKTGTIEVDIEELQILNASLVPPFPLDSRESVSEDLRLKYRYLDLRRKEMRDAVIMRHRVMQETRKYLTENRFIEIETPMLNKSTPEGARDFLVPSRINRGMFFALPQSPQLFKQILMVAGFDRYFQIVKCFRDEDLRNDRQPEFTQIDLEMSFVTPDMVMGTIEGLLKRLVIEMTGKEIKDSFPRLTYDEAMSRFGKDAPDMRFGLELVECSDIFRESQFQVFTGALAARGIIKGMAVADEGKISRKMVDDYAEFVKIYRAKGMPWVRFRSGNFEGGISKFLSDTEKDALVKAFDLQGDMLVIFSSDRKNIVNDTLGNLRVKIARDLKLFDEDELNFLWVTDFPLLEYSEEEGRYYATHHPFTSPSRESIGLLDNLTPDNVGGIKAQAYDVVLNGVEIGGGSIRISDTVLQGKIFSVLGISDEEAKVKFSFLLEALKFGAPPHGGIALGLDRVLMIIMNKNSIRDVIPFPKTQRGQCPMSEAPSPVDDDQLKELSIKLVER